MTPDVCVVLIGYNDSERLPTAVASVLDQTLSNLELIIVDDASTDGMGDLADTLATHSPKVRSVRLPTNSGGCSRPRNVGLEGVRAPYVMFLDSDDVLERHACKNLLLALERSGADFAAGRCVRVDMDSGDESPWQPGLYDEGAVWEGIRENPRLLTDTLCTNKLYRMSFLDEHGIRFPEGLHFEDLAFSAEAYRWQIYASNPTASIHRSRGQIENFRDRIAIHRSVDAFLEREGLEDLKVITDDRFLAHVLKLYLDGFAERDAAYQQEWMQLAGDYLRTIDERHIMSQVRACRLTTYLIRRGNVPLATSAAELWLKGRVTVPLVSRGNRVYFADAYLEDPEGRRALDVTWLHAHDARFDKLPLTVTLTELEQANGTIRLRGYVINQLGRIPTGGALSITLRLRDEQMMWWQGVDVPVTDFTLDADQLTWQAEVDVQSLPRGRSRRVTWHFNFRMASRNRVNGQGIRALGDALPAQRAIPVGGGRSRGTLTATITRHGALALQDNRPVPALPVKTRLARRAKRLGVVRHLSNSLSGRPIKTFAYRHVLRRLPLRRNTVVFESHLGKQYSDSPKYIYQKMVAMGLPHRAVWAYARNRSRYPDQAVKVRRDSWRYYYELARAGYIVDNQGLPPVVTRRSGQRYLQTWHGSPFKHMGFDEPRFARSGSPEARQRFKTAVARWDDFVVQSSWSEGVFREAFRLKSRILRTGYPRNDPLHQAGDPAIRAELRRRLGLPDDRKILLYAPTFRRYPKPVTIGNPANSPRIDLGRFQEELGEEWVLVLRAHYLDRISVPRRFANVARNMSRYDDISDLLVVADAVLTDYSSIMFDFAITGRPMAFFTSDYELYRSMRGSYFDLPDEAPGPTVLTTPDIIDWLRDLEGTQERYHKQYQAFRDRYCEFEDGSAAERIIRQVFLDERGAG
jgi:CDP-glycerol glycerophosphotransferase